MIDELEGKEALAGEYVLGTLEHVDRRQAKALIINDPIFASMVAEWEQRLGPLTDGIEAVEPPSMVWSAIDQELDPVEQPAAPANQNRPFWRGFITAAVAASLLFAMIGGTLWNLQPLNEPQLVAVLLDSEANPGALVEAVDDQVRIVPLIDIAVPEGQTLEVWTLQDPSAGPVSLGLLPQAKATDLSGFDLPSPNVGQLYEISLEPAGGSPVGRPTGPVLFKGYAKIPL